MSATHRAVILWQSMLTDKPLVSFPYFSWDEFRSEGQRTAATSSKLSSGSHLSSVLRKRDPVKCHMKTRRRIDAQTAGLCCDVITVRLLRSSSWPSALRFFPFLCHPFPSRTYLPSSWSIKSANEKGAQQCPSAQILNQRQPTTSVSWADITETEVQRHGWYPPFKNTSTMQSAISAFWHSFSKEMLKAKKVSCHENDINIS